MITRILSGVLLTTMVAPAVDGDAPRDEAVRPADAAVAVAWADLNILPESRLWFDGGSTVRAYTCEATTLDGAVVALDGAAARVAALEGAVETVTIRIDVAALECGNGTMNDHMRKALEADKHPRIEFRVTGYDVAETGPGAGTIEMRGALTITGTTRDVTIQADVEERADGTLAVRGSKTIDMTEYGVRPPRLMLGTLKVHDEVEVHFDMVLGG